MPRVDYRYTGRHGQDHRVTLEASKEEIAHVLQGIIQAIEGLEASAPARRTGPRRPGKVVRHSTGPTAHIHWRDVEEKMPSSKDVEAYIRGLPARRHSHPDIARHFLGRAVKASADTSEERALFYRLQRRIDGARENIAKSDKSGAFVKEGRSVFGSTRTYVWAARAAPDGAV